MALPRISIITITYNCASTIRETMESVLAQDYPQLDYVLIDGGSSDKTTEIINEYKSQLGYVCSEKDRGISDAFNKGIAHAKGELIGIINSGDLLMPGALHALAEHYSEDIDIYRTNVRIHNPETGKSYREVPSMQFPICPIRIHVAHPGTFITANAYKKWGTYGVDLRYVMDLDLLTRMYRHGARMQYIDLDSTTFILGGTTSTAMKNKRFDYEQLVIRNGGSLLRAKIYYLEMLSVDIAKRIITGVFSLDTLKRLHYGK